MITFIAEQHQGCYGCQANKHSQNNQALPDYTLVRLVNDFPAVLLFLEGTAGRYDLTLQLLFFIFTAHRIGTAHPAFSQNSSFAYMQ